MPKRSEAWDQVNDRAKEKKIVCRVGEAGHTIIVLKGMNYVIIAPSGSGRGQRASDRARPERQRRDVSGKARSGGRGGGRDVGFARGFDLVISPHPPLPPLSPPRERGGAASV